MKIDVIFYTGFIMCDDSMCWKSDSEVDSCFTQLMSPIIFFSCSPLLLRIPQAEYTKYYLEHQFTVEVFQKLLCSADVALFSDWSIVEEKDLWSSKSTMHDVHPVAYYVLNFCIDINYCISAPLFYVINVANRSLCSYWSFLRSLFLFKPLVFFCFECKCTKINAFPLRIM